MITISWWIFAPMALWTVFGFLMLCGSVYDVVTCRPRTPLHDIPPSEYRSGESQ